MRITAQDGAMLEVMQPPGRKRPQLLYSTDGHNYDVFATFASAEVAERFCRFFETTTQVRTDKEAAE